MSPLWLRMFALSSTFAFPSNLGTLHLVLMMIGSGCFTERWDLSLQSSTVVP